MKTLSDYTIYCTEEQTRKALEIGAPINKRYNCYTDFTECILDKSTAEQMLGWLDENLPEICDIAIEYKIEKGKWVYFFGWRESEPIYNSRKEATLAAIDTALEYLANKK